MRSNSIKAIDDRLIEQPDCWICDFVEQDPFNPIGRAPKIAFDKMPVNQVFEYKSWLLVSSDPCFDYDDVFPRAVNNCLIGEIDNIELLCA